MVLRVSIELTRPKALVSKTSAATYYAIGAKLVSRDGDNPALPKMVSFKPALSIIFTIGTNLKYTKSVAQYRSGATFAPVLQKRKSLNGNCKKIGPKS